MSIDIGFFLYGCGDDLAYFFLYDLQNAYVLFAA